VKPTKSAALQHRTGQPESRGLIEPKRSGSQVGWDGRTSHARTVGASPGPGRVIHSDCVALATVLRTSTSGGPREVTQ
jgi:hypothetical protein